MICGGLLSGRQMRSPAPVHIARPSESCTSGRQSIAVAFIVSENQYIEVSGAMPKRDDVLCAVKMRASMSITTPLPRVIRKAKAPVTRGALQQGVDA